MQYNPVIGQETQMMHDLCLCFRCLREVKGDVCVHIQGGSYGWNTRRTKLQTTFSKKGPTVQFIVPNFDMKQCNVQPVIYVEQRKQISSST